jgi:predicted enzyme related to lactoylglutathione lyase
MFHQEPGFRSPEAVNVSHEEQVDLREAPLGRDVEGRASAAPAEAGPDHGAEEGELKSELWEGAIPFFPIEIIYAACYSWHMLSKADFATIVPVRKMDRAIKFYTDALGGKLTMRGEGDMKDVWASVRVAGADFWLITPQKAEKRELAYSTFIVKNIKESVKGLRANGVRFQKAEKMGPDSKVEGPITSDSFGAAAFFKDSEGNLLMLWQGQPPA